MDDEEREATAVETKFVHRLVYEFGLEMGTGTTSNIDTSLFRLDVRVLDDGHLDCCLRFKKRCTWYEVMACCYENGYSIPREMWTSDTPRVPDDEQILLVIGAGISGSFPNGTMTRCDVCRGIATFRIDEALYHKMTAYVESYIRSYDIAPIGGCDLAPEDMDSSDDDGLSEKMKMEARALPGGFRRVCRKGFTEYMADHYTPNGERRDVGPDDDTLPVECQALFEFLGFYVKNNAFFMTREEKLFQRLDYLLNRSASVSIMKTIERLKDEGLYGKTAAYIYVHGSVSDTHGNYEIGTLDRDNRGVSGFFRDLYLEFGQYYP